MMTLYRRTYMVVVLAALVAGAWLVDSPFTRLALAVLAGGLTFVLIYSRGVAMDSLGRSLDAERVQTQILELLLRGNLAAFQMNLERALRTVATFGRAHAGLLCRLEQGRDPQVLAWAAGGGGSAVPPRGLEKRLATVWERLESESSVQLDDGPVPLLLVPVMDAGVLWGAVGLYDRQGDGPWSPREVQLLSVVAGMMGAAYGRHRAEAAIQAALEQAHASSEAKSRFLANMSHEIRTPLNCIVGLSEHLNDLDHSREQGHCLELIRHSSDVLLQIINDILDLSRIEAGGIAVASEEFDLHRLLANTSGMFTTRATDKGLSLDLDLPDDLPRRVRGDEARLGQILTNLVGNAVKFTDEGGICLAVTELPPHRHGGPPCYRFDVTDSGIGIAADKLDCVFDSFAQADASTTRLYGGTGLGLAISRSLAELMGGRLSVASLLGRGSVFSLELPLALVASDAPVEDSVPAPVVDAPVRFPGKRVLVVEDDGLNQLVARKVLRSLDCEVEIAEDGKVALDLVNWQEFDLILMDYMMPGMDGPETTRQLRQLDGWTAHVPVVALTANALDTHEKACLEAGMDGFLTKPIRKKDLVGLLASLPVAAPVS